MRTTTTKPTAVALPRCEELRPEIYVIHPLDDEPEEKRSPEGLGLMHMSGMRRASLITLRGYLILMILLVLFKAVSLAGFIDLHP